MSKIIIGKLNAICVFSAWSFFAITIGYLVYLYFFGNYEGAIVTLAYIFGAFALFTLAHLVLAFFVRCPSCNKCITVQGINKPHPKSRGGWSGVIWRWLSGSVVCIHCGSQVNTNAL